MKKAIVLCSGGVDSVTLANYVKNDLFYEKVDILFFDYGQKTVNKERDFSKECVKNIGGNFREIKIPELGVLSVSLINKKGKPNRVNREDLRDTKQEMTNWYVPFRNSIFLSYALSLAESLYIKEKVQYDIYIGIKSDDSFPDTSSEFLKTINRLGEYSNSCKFKIFAPFIDKDKSDIFLVAKKLGVKLEKTFSCYVGKEKHCGTCLSCRLRQEGFSCANISDPTEYSEIPKDFRLAQ